MNTKTKFFETKQQYQAFRKAFGLASIDPRAKSKLIPLGKGNEKYRQKGWLRPEHYIFLNLIRGKSMYSGFTPKTQENYINHNSGTPERALSNGLWVLNRAIFSATEYLRLPENSESTVAWYKKMFSGKADDTLKAAHERDQKYRKETISAFLGPFNGTVTIEQLASLVIDNNIVTISLPISDTLKLRLVGKILSYPELFDIYEGKTEFSSPPVEMVLEDIQQAVG